MITYRASYDITYRESEGIFFTISNERKFELIC